MKINTLAPAKDSKRRSKRIGRGLGSGHGKTATKGHKGQKARSGGTKGPAFEGGQTPLQRRLPKRGFKNYPFKKEYDIVNLSDVEGLHGFDVITPDILYKNRIVKSKKKMIKVLGNGEINRPISIKAHAFSSSAIAKINAAGGKAEIITK